MTAAVFLDGASKMGSTATLTSLAMLKIEIDNGGDYLDYLKPFVEQALFEERPDTVTDAAVVTLIREKYGLEIPARTIQLVLQKLAKAGKLTKENGLFFCQQNIKSHDMVVRKSTATRHINNVIKALIAYSTSTNKAIPDEAQAVQVICNFLSEFDITCLKAYLRGTTIPAIKNHSQTDIVLVSEFVLDIQQSQPEVFSNFITLLQGHMLANALLCPDLQNAPRSFKGVTFFLDTPVLIQALGYDGSSKQNAAIELINLLRSLDARVSTFSHTLEELVNVLKGSANHLDDFAPTKSSIQRFARENGLTKSDLLLAATQAEQELLKLRVSITQTPTYEAKHQIDEKLIEGALKEEIQYLNERARDYDINSIRSIYALRHGTSPQKIEKCTAALVTNNTALAKVAYEHGNSGKTAQDVSSVITDFSLANLAWLKAPMKAPNIPTAELLAYSYAAKQPSSAWLEKYVDEIEKLEKNGSITARDHQLLRSSFSAQDELMKLTLGDETALQERSIRETLLLINEQIKAEERKNTDQEMQRRKEAEQDLADSNDLHKKILRNLEQSCKTRAFWSSFFISFGLMTLVILGAAISFLKSSMVIGQDSIIVIGIVEVIFACFSGIALITGISIHSIFKRLNYFLFRKYIELEKHKLLK